jgi:hypothetical protein
MGMLPSRSWFLIRLVCMMLASAPVTSIPAAYCATSLVALLAMDVVTADVVAAETAGTSAVKTLLIRGTLGT